ncbi:MAG: hypothetical protein Q9213_000343 [Squamulea squamosa]
MSYYANQPAQYEGEAPAFRQRYQREQQSPQYPPQSLEQPSHYQPRQQPYETSGHDYEANQYEAGQQPDGPYDEEPNPLSTSQTYPNTSQPPVSPRKPATMKGSAHSPASGNISSPSHPGAQSSQPSHLAPGHPGEQSSNQPSPLPPPPTSSFENGAGAIVAPVGPTAPQPPATLPSPGEPQPGPANTRNYHKTHHNALYHMSATAKNGFTREHMESFIHLGVYALGALANSHGLAPATAHPGGQQY